jgi:hypothetical protein
MSFFIFFAEKSSDDNLVSDFSTFFAQTQKLNTYKKVQQGISLETLFEVAENSLFNFL